MPSKRGFASASGDCALKQEAVVTTRDIEIFKAICYNIDALRLEKARGLHSLSKENMRSLVILMEIRSSQLYFKTFHFCQYELCWK